MTITDDQAGQRLDVLVGLELPEVSRAYIQRLCDMGKITVNGKETKPGHKLKVGDKVKIDYSLDELTDIPQIKLPILYEDDDCVVMNKPVGVLTHSKGAFNPEATVATFLREHVSDDLKGERAGIVHRLDRATSGVIIGAKNQAALSWLQKQFAQRRVKKHYIAIVNGHLKPVEAIIDMPIERNPKAPATFRVGANGKPALTHYKVLEENDTASLVELRPETGRTHQLRVHLKQLGHPIIGDTLYGTVQADRLFLHAASLEITLPNRERKVFEAAVPIEFKNYMEQA